MNDYQRFRITKLERLLIPTIKHELHNARLADKEHYEVMLSEYRLELKERKKKIGEYN